MNDASTAGGRLLARSDRPPVRVHNGQGRSRFVITCEHAGAVIPAALGDLGVGPADRARHIAWDIGAAEVARRLGDAVGAPVVLQTYSRLVIDCNRPTTAADSIPEASDGTPVPGNRNLGPQERSRREREIHRPFHAAVAALLDERSAAGREPLLVAFHTFTPALAMDPTPRPWDMGLLYNRDRRLAARLDDTLQGMAHGFRVAHNEPYSVYDETDYTLPVHGEGRGIHSLLLEVRNDHVRDEGGWCRWAAFLAAALTATERAL